MENSFVFRYSNLFKYYIVWFGGHFSSFIVFIPLFRIFLAETGIYSFDERIPISDFGLQNPWFYFGITLGIPVCFYVLSFLAFLWIGNFTTDSAGIAKFYDDYFEFKIGRKTVKRDYADIKKIVYKLVFPSKGTFAPQLEILKIKCFGKNLKIHCSFREAWESRKTDRPLSVFNIATTLSIITEQDIVFKP